MFDIHTWEEIRKMSPLQVINSLKSKFEFPKDVFLEDDEILSQNCGLSLKLVKKFKIDLAALTYKDSFQLQTSSSLKHKNKLSNTILDNIFYSGLPSNVITEIFGPAGSGKTQICLHLMAQALTFDTDSKVLFISTQEKFPIERFNSMLGVSHEINVLDRIHLQYLLDPDMELHFLTFGLVNLTNEFRYKLIVYDGIASNSRIINNTFDKSAHIQQIIASFRKLFQNHSLIIFITNQVTDVPISSNSDSLKVSALGLTLENCVNIKIFIEKENYGGIRTLKVLKSLFTPLEKERFVISDKGLEIVED